MRPPFNSVRPQARPHRPQQQQQQNNGYSNHRQHNGFQNPMQANQLRMMNPQMMGNPMMGHTNNSNSMPNMPVPPQFVNNLSNMPQQQLQQQLQQFAMPNHINQLLPNLLGLQFALANSNLMGQSLPLVQPNFFQPQLNSFNARPHPPVPNPHQNHQLRPPSFSDPRPQGQSVGIINNANGSGPKGNNFRNKFTKHQKLKGPGQGFQRSQFHQANNGKKNYGFNKDHRSKGNYNKTKTGLDGSNTGNIAEKKRSYALIYTPKEIKQWREARRKNFPTKHYVEKKVKKNVSDSTLDKEAKMRRQQLREVLAKQAELGVEVAEVPSHYLSDTDGQVNGDRGNNNENFQYKVGQKGRFQKNRHNKRRNDGKDKFAKKTRLEDENSSKESSMITRKPTLLEKLLSADIKRDKSQLLQVFRCMVMNSFFKEFPEQPLKLPLVMVEETGSEHAREDPLTEVLCDDLSDDDADDATDDDDDGGDGDDVDVNGDDDDGDDIVNCDDDVDMDVNCDDNSCDVA